MKVLITGAKGSIGHNLVQYLSKYKQIELYTLSRQICDLSNAKEVDSFFEGKYFDVVVHTAFKYARIIGDEDKSVIFENLAMTYNLINNANHYQHMIQFGSGAELRNYNSVTYDMGKRTQWKLFNLELPNFYHFRIFSNFYANEATGRFITSNIKRYINHNPLYVDADRWFDFFYLEDFMMIIYYYLKNLGLASLPKELDMCYMDKYKLSQVSTIINNLDTHKEQIIVGKTVELDYIGDGYRVSQLGLPLIGLKEGIKQVYYKIKEQAYGINQNL